MRKLASIQIVSELLPIEGADAIELAKMQDNAWQCVVKKGELKVGDLAVYMEIDSLLPVRDEFAFMASRGTKTMADGSVGFRLKTVKLKGCISQGLLLPWSTFSSLQVFAVAPGDDVTELLGVKLFEGPVAASLAGDAKGSFPGCLRKTDQERIQNLPWVLETCANMKFEVSVKLDGSSMTSFINGDEFGVCSRNLNLKNTEGNRFWCIARQYSIEEKLKKFHERTGRNLAIQGEVVGEGIQKNRDKIKGHKLFVFDIWDIDKQWHLLPDERAIVIDQLNMLRIGSDLEQVPLFRIGELGHMTLTKTVAELLLLAEGLGYNSDNREGLVFKACERDRNGQVFSFKAISNRYLLKCED